MNKFVLSKYKYAETVIHTFEFKPQDTNVVFDVVKPTYRTKLSQIFSGWWKSLFYKKVAGVNGSFFPFTEKSYPGGLNYLYAGILFSDTIYNDAFIEMVFDNNRLSVGNWIYKDIKTLFPKAEWAISPGHLLVKDGKKDLLKADNFDHANYPNPRTMVGQKADGTIILAVSGGRNIDGRGLTASEQADFMLMIGAFTAVNCDGGGSSTLWVDGNVVNRPTDGVERAIANGLLVYCKGSYEIEKNDYTVISEPAFDGAKHYFIDKGGHAQTNFSWSEVACNCGDLYIPDCVEQRNKLQALRDLGNKNYHACIINVDVWYRCQKCNQRLIDLYNQGLYPNKPSPTSLHLKAMASDIHMMVRTSPTSDWTELPSGTVSKLAQQVGFNNIGMYDTFTHVGNSQHDFLIYDNRTK